MSINCQNVMPVCLCADCHVIVFNVEDAVAGMLSEMANIDVGNEPVDFCILSPDAKVLLSCDDDGQLETWSTEHGMDS